MSWAFLATKGQSAAVAAQYMLSRQQNQLASGQQPAGHEVSSGPHCLFLAIFMSWAFLATKGQSAAVAAQYMLSGQQNQLASGQQPAEHKVVFRIAKSLFPSFTLPQRSPTITQVTIEDDEDDVMMIVRSPSPDLISNNNNNNSITSTHAKPPPPAESPSPLVPGPPLTYNTTFSSFSNPSDKN